MTEDVGRVTAVEVAVAATCIATKGRRVCEDGGGLGHELTAAVKSVAAETDRLVFKALVVQENHISTSLCCLLLVMRMFVLSFASVTNDIYILGFQPSNVGRRNDIFILIAYICYPSV